MSSDAGLDLGRLGRTLALIGFVTAVFLILTSARLEGAAFQIGAVAIGTMALVTAMIGFLIAVGSTYDS